MCVQAQGDLSGCMGMLRDVQYRLLAKLVQLGAYNHCNVDQASAFSLDSAMKNYHVQTGSTVSKCVLAMILHELNDEMTK